jgi:hypothetical protein
MNKTLEPNTYTLEQPRNYQETLETNIYNWGKIE